MKYLPFLTGIYSTAPALSPALKAESDYDKLVFQIDDNYHSCINNKTECRKENLHKYYCTGNFYKPTMRCITSYMAARLQKKHPSVFELNDEYETSFFSNSKTRVVIQWNKASIQNCLKDFINSSVNVR